MVTAMKISSADRNLNPQPLPSVKKPSNLNGKKELELNKKRLREAKEEMKIIKEQINKYIHVLIKEIGEDADLKDFIRKGHSPGWLGRAQTLMNLKLRLAAIRSQYLSPPHKMYYKGPFDPKKEFDLKCIPEKQENLFQKMLEEKKTKILLQCKPVDVLTKELDDLKLMHKAARFRDKSLVSKLKDAKSKLEKVKERAAADLRIVESMMAHQSMYKMMIDPETFQLDPDLKHVASEKPVTIPEGAKFKKMQKHSEEELKMLQEASLVLAQKLDKIHKDLIEAEQINCKNILFVEEHATKILNEGTNSKVKSADKDKASPDEVEMVLLKQENRQFREFLFSSVLSTEEDLNLFTDSVNIFRNRFILSLTNSK